MKRQIAEIETEEENGDGRMCVFTFSLLFLLFHVYVMMLLVRITHKREVPKYVHSFENKQLYYSSLLFFFTNLEKEMELVSSASIASEEWNREKYFFSFIFSLSYCCITKKLKIIKKNPKLRMSFLSFFLIDAY